MVTFSRNRTSLPSSAVESLSAPCPFFNGRSCLFVQAGSADEDSNYWTKMMSVIRGEIQEYRSELDALTMKRTQMERKLKQVRRACNRRSRRSGPG